MNVLNVNPVTMSLTKTDLKVNVFLAIINVRNVMKMNSLNRNAPNVVAIMLYLKIS